jgi:hypothetical protein
MQSRILAIRGKGSHSADNIAAEQSNSSSLLHDLKEVEKEAWTESINRWIWMDDWRRRINASHKYDKRTRAKIFLFGFSCRTVWHRPLCAIRKVFDNRRIHPSIYHHQTIDYDVWKAITLPPFYVSISKRSFVIIKFTLWTRSSKAVTIVASCEGVDWGYQVDGSIIYGS